jgi:hypothetical protein
MFRKFYKITPDPLFNEGRKNWYVSEDLFVETAVLKYWDGYTDHCPVCLWGKHVDFEIPGDRESDCRALMKPIEVQYIGGKYKILYRCSGCSHTFWANRR